MRRLVCLSLELDGVLIYEIEELVQILELAVIQLLHQEGQVLLIVKHNNVLEVFSEVNSHQFFELGEKLLEVVLNQVLEFGKLDEIFEKLQKHCLGNQVQFVSEGPLSKLGVLLHYFEDRLVELARVKFLLNLLDRVIELLFLPQVKIRLVVLLIGVDVSQIKESQIPVFESFQQLLSLLDLNVSLDCLLGVLESLVVFNVSLNEGLGLK